jgi:hypothetical protein
VEPEHTTRLGESATRQLSFQLSAHHLSPTLAQSNTTPQLLGISINMDGLQLRDEAVRDRVRAAQEFLDPSMLPLLKDCICG